MKGSYHPFESPETLILTFELIEPIFAVRFY